MRAILPAAAAALPRPVPISAFTARGTHALDGATLLLRRRDPIAKAALEHLLESGRASGSGSIGGGTFGLLDLRTVGGVSGAQAVFKGPKRNAAEEILAYQLASAIGIDWAVPVVGRRRDGSAAIELLAGLTPRAEGIKHPNDMSRVLRTWYRTNYPNMPAREVVQRAQRDRQLLQTFDYLLAIRDRNPGNAIIDRVAGTVQLIDNASLGASQTLNYHRYRWMQGGSGFTPDDRALLPKSTKPHMATYGRTWSQGQVRLEAGALMVLGAADRAAIDRAFAQYERATRNRAVRESFLRRLDHVVETGGFRLGGDPVLPRRVSGP